MNIILNKNLENQTAFFELDGQQVALDLVSHTLYTGELDGEVDADFEVEQDWDNEATRFIFNDFTIVYCMGELEIMLTVQSIKQYPDQLCIVDNTGEEHIISVGSQTGLFTRDEWKKYDGVISLFRAESQDLILDAIQLMSHVAYFKE